MGDDPKPGTGEGQTTPPEGQAQGGQQQEPPEGGQQKPPATDWQAKAREWEKRAKDNKTAADELAQLKQSQMTEQQKLEAHASAAEKAATEHAVENMRLKVAIEKQLPIEMAARLQGGTLEELQADADKLVELIGRKPGEGQNGQTQRPDLRQGSHGQAPPEDGNAWLRAFAQGR